MVAIFTNSALYNQIVRFFLGLFLTDFGPPLPARIKFTWTEKKKHGATGSGKHQVMVKRSGYHANGPQCPTDCRFCNAAIAFIQGKILRKMSE